MTDFAALSAPFAPDRISWRVGSTTERDGKLRGMALAYIDARDVMDRLDAVCGPAGWQCDYPHANGKTVCRIGIRVEADWIWKADGAGDTDYEAEKGALSDAFKRAAVRWGIGRYLYDLDSPWVECERRGKTAFIVKTELPRLQALLRRGQPQLAAPVKVPDTDAEEGSASLRLSREMSAKLWKVSGIEAVKAVTDDPQFRQHFRALEEEDRERVGKLIQDRRAVA